MVYPNQLTSERTFPVMCGLGLKRGYGTPVPDMTKTWKFVDELVHVALALLARADISVDDVGEHGDTALILACKHEMSKVALTLLARKDTSITDVNEDGKTALIYACNR